MPVKTFNISFPQELADQIDEVATRQFGSRSDFLRVAALKYIRSEQEFQEIMHYGKNIGKAIGYQSEEEVADHITNLRRQREPWRQSPLASK